MKNPRVLALAATALISTGGAVAGTVAPSVAGAATPAPVAAEKSLPHDFQLQDTFYNCGPSATRVALSAHGKTYSQAEVVSTVIGKSS
jgi:hypothetical protein